MKKYKFCIMIASLVLASLSTMVSAEPRRDSAGGSAQAYKKAQYMVRQLHDEKQALQSQLTTLQGKFDQLTKENKKTKASLERSSSNNDKLVSRVKGTVGKYKALAGKYRELISILKKANMDNQYMVRAVQERETWISSCSALNEKLFDANSDLLVKYGNVATDKTEPFIGIARVKIENEVQDYQFKLEDLQVTKFKPTVNVASHSDKLAESDTSDAGKGVRSDSHSNKGNL